MTNPVLRKAVCPAKVDKCTPDGSSALVDIVASDFWYTGEVNWDETIPSEAAADWNCKIRVKLWKQMYIGKSTKQRGWNLIQIENYGFDDNVYLIVNPQGRYKDFRKDDPVNDITRVYKIDFGRKLYIPAEYELLFSYAPVASRSGKTFAKGKFRYRVKKVTEFDEGDETDKSVIRMFRPADRTDNEANNDGMPDAYYDGVIDFERLENGGEVPAPAAPAADGGDAGAAGAAVNKKTNWDGLEMDVWGDWVDKEIVFGNYNILIKTVAYTFIIVTVVIVIVVIIIMICSWRNRETIQHVAR